jgi:hypothetical protein
VGAAPRLLGRGGIDMQVLDQVISMRALALSALYLLSMSILFGAYAMTLPT